MAVVNDKVTTVGGTRRGRSTNTLLYLKDPRAKLLPPMPTAKVRPAAVTTPTHLIIAGGETGRGSPLSTVEILDTDTLQPAAHPKHCNWDVHICYYVVNTCTYLNTTQSSHALWKNSLSLNCKPTKSRDGDSVWTKLSNIPVPYWASLATLRG